MTDCIVLAQSRRNSQLVTCRSKMLTSCWHHIWHFFTGNGNILLAQANTIIVSHLSTFSFTFDEICHFHLSRFFIFVGQVSFSSVVFHFHLSSYIIFIREFYHSFIQANQAAHKFGDKLNKIHYNVTVVDCLLYLKINSLL